MLHGHISVPHTSRSNVVVWTTLAFQAGLLNIGGYIACHQFVSHVTGYATLAGFELSRERYIHALAMLVVPFFFLVGAMVSGLMVDVRIYLEKKPRYYVTFGLIFGLIVLVLAGGEFGYFSAFGAFQAHRRDYALISLLCFICGIQNATVSSVSRSAIRTTHMTGVVTDLGISLARLLHRRDFRNPPEGEPKASFIKLGLLVAFGLGSVIGGFLFPKLGFLGFLAPALTAGCLFAAAVLNSIKNRSAMAGNTGPE